jgi:hypothetical protein
VQTLPPRFEIRNTHTRLVRMRVHLVRMWVHPVRMRVSGEQLPNQIADGTGLSIVLCSSIFSSYPARV